MQRVNLEALRGSRKVLGHKIGAHTQVPPDRRALHAK
jgi:hypothetical protein